MAAIRARRGSLENVDEGIVRVANADRASVTVTMVAYSQLKSVQRRREGFRVVVHELTRGRMREE